MKLDKWKNKSKSDLMDSDFKHGKPDIKKPHREKQRIKNTLRNIDVHNLDEFDDLD